MLSISPRAFFLHKNLDLAKISRKNLFLKVRQSAIN